MVRRLSQCNVEAKAVMSPPYVGWWEVDLQTVCNLLRRPAIDPLAVTPMRLVAADERSLPRSGDLAPLSIMDLALQAVLNILAQLRIGPSSHARHACD
ncbi:hypothetical protein AO062_20130 [Variovorax boronicumulans]|nr:hypothetical protein AO062_20130 [Variovorax boronicumulans]